MFLWWVIIVSRSCTARRVVPHENATRRLTTSRRPVSPPRTRKKPLTQFRHPRSPSDHEITSLPGLPSRWRGRHWAGTLTSDPATGGRIFYWFFEKKEPSSEKDPLLIWLNGGPGCTSMDGMFLENGPISIDERGVLGTRTSSWHAVANVLYVDQPVGTGYSWSEAAEYCRNDACIARHFRSFLAAFAELHSDLVLTDTRKSVPILFGGESHAGHYIPILVDNLLQSGNESDIEWDVRGMALGNGWIDPYHQYDVSRQAQALGLITEGQAISLRLQERACQSALEKQQFMTKVCWNLLDDVLRYTAETNRDRLKTNMYDARESSRSTASFPPNHDKVESYLNRPDVRSALHVDPSAPRFRECANPPYNALKHQDGLGVVSTLAQLLDHTHVRILFYNGQYDLICNHVGVHRALSFVPWRGRQSFREAPYRPWRRTSGGPVAGYVLDTGRLSLLIVADAGHMVPMNQPEVALDMIETFVSATLHGEAPRFFHPPDHHHLSHCMDKCRNDRRRLAAPSNKPVSRGRHHPAFMDVVERNNRTWHATRHHHNVTYEHRRRPPPRFRRHPVKPDSPSSSPWWEQHGEKQLHKKTFVPKTGDIHPLQGPRRV